MAKLLATGSKSKMSKMAANLAEEARDQSFSEKDLGKHKRGRVPKTISNDFETTSPSKRKMQPREGPSTKKKLRREAHEVILALEP
ncbi:unnamed protein product, partial [Allacma fusca]